VSFWIRTLAVQDLDRILILAADSVEAPHWNRRDYERILLTTPADPLVRHGLVAHSGGNIVGFAVTAWFQQETTADLEVLFVEHACRRGGIGSALIKACMTWAAQAGASTVRLEVRASNAGALALYRRHGFVAAGVRRAYYSAPVEDALLLKAPLFPGHSVPL
jgi:[ribosomal protein S18]-alanine N-acetyltransferase